MTTGDRLIYLRKMIKSSRREIEKLTNGKVKMSALSQIESSRNTLTIENALSILCGLKSKGIVCTLDWLYTGEGMPPKKIDVMNNPFNMLEEANFFVEKNPECSVSIINDNCLSPDVSVGDYMGFQRIDRSLIKNKKSLGMMYRIILTNGSTIISRIVYNKMKNIYIIYKNDIDDIELYSDEEINSIEQVLWIRKHI